MKMYDIIYKKREGYALTKEEIDFFITGYTKGEIPDYQVSALLMAIFFQDINHDETLWLTQSMRDSGEIVDLSEIPGAKIDKHSTGGVGDKTTLIVAPICASCGVPIAKMSGRGLGFTGGTVDKLESIPGLRTSLSKQEFIQMVKKTGLSLIGQSADIAAADKLIYALRDVTATVDHRGLITASIMSKKLALGSDGVVLDVKCGDGAFVKTQEEALLLAQGMVEIGKAAGKKMAALITDMQQPLGLAVGNSLEVIEAMETLKGRGPEDLTELSLALAGYMIYLGERADSFEAGYQMAKERIQDGSAIAKWKEFVKMQGGMPEIAENYEMLPKGEFHLDIFSKDAGYLSEVSAQKIGEASQLSGAGRGKKEDSIDYGAGIYLNKKIGDSVKEGELLATIYGSDKRKLQESGKAAEHAFKVSKSKKEKASLILKTVE